MVVYQGSIPGTLVVKREGEYAANLSKNEKPNLYLQVFILLQTVYQAFDAIAKRRRGKKLCATSRNKVSSCVIFLLVFKVGKQSWLCKSVALNTDVS